MRALDRALPVLSVQNQQAQCHALLQQTRRVPGRLCQRRRVSRCNCVISNVGPIPRLRRSDRFCGAAHEPVSVNEPQPRRAAMRRLEGRWGDRADLAIIRSVRNLLLCPRHRGPSRAEGEWTPRRIQSGKSPPTVDFVSWAEAFSAGGALGAQEPVAFRTVVTTGASALRVQMPATARPRCTTAIAFLHT